jgi:hypothetical protein
VDEVLPEALAGPQAERGGDLADLGGAEQRATLR